MSDILYTIKNVCASLFLNSNVFYELKQNLLYGYCVYSVRQAYVMHITKRLIEFQRKFIFIYDLSMKF